MNLIIPNNIYSAIFALCAKDKQDLNLIIKESPLITRELLGTENSIALIPSLDLIQHKDLFVSKKFAITFTDILSNSYLYFSSESESINSLLLQGDISSNEVILSKIIFNEKFDLAPEISLDTNMNTLPDKTYLISGSNNWLDNKFEKAASFSEYVIETIDAPYVNFILVSQNEAILKNFANTLHKLNPKLESKLNIFLKDLDYPEKVKKYLKENINTISFDTTEDDIHSLNELLQMVYFNQVYDKLFDVKFV